MPAEQFSTPVRGSAGDPVQMSQTGSLETNDYDHGDGFVVSGYPTEINPAETIHEVVITESADIVMEVHTVGGDTFDLELRGAVGAWNRWRTDKLVFKDPNGTGAEIAGAWAGD